MAKSLAIWLENPNDNPELTLHVNFWALNSGDLAYLDVGVRFSAKGKWDAINVYLPFSKRDITYTPQLGKLVCDDKQLLSAVFNKRLLGSENRDDESQVLDFGQDEAGEEDILQFFTALPKKEDDDSTYGVQIKKIKEGETEGVQLSFPRKLFKRENVAGYFRFRLVLQRDAYQAISHIYKSNERALTNHFEKTEMVDFRINEPRNLPIKIRTELNNPSCLKRVDFFLIREAYSEFKMSHSDYHRCRLLERHAWDDYLEPGLPDNINVPAQMLIYHWKEQAKRDKSIDHFAAFAKFTRWHIRRREIAAVVLAILTLGILTGLATNVIWTQVQNDVKSESQAEKAAVHCIIEKPVCPTPGVQLSQLPSQKAGETSETPTKTHSTTSTLTQTEQEKSKR